MKSGILAAEDDLRCAKAGDTFREDAERFPGEGRAELHQERTVASPQFYHSRFQHGMLAGFVHTAFQQITGGPRLD